MSKPLYIAHLYPNLLNLYGDKGNILTLCRRLEWRGVDYKVEEIGIGEHDKKFTDYDLFFIGGGQDSGQLKVARDLLLRKNEIIHVVEAGVPMLAVCGGYQLMGKSYQTSEGVEMEGLGILDIETKAKARAQGGKQDRLVGNVSAQLLLGLELEAMGLLRDARNDSGVTLVGFENHSGRTYIMAQGSGLRAQGNSSRAPSPEPRALVGTRPLAKIIKGYGNNGEDGYEGAYYNNLIGTYLHGSLLPKNPHLADELLYRALKYSSHPYLDEHDGLLELDDALEHEAHRVAIGLK